MTGGCLVGVAVAALAVTANNLSTGLQDRGPACLMPDHWGTGGSGRVVGFLSPADKAALIARTQRDRMGTISPAYLPNKRAVISVSGPEGFRRVVALVPDAMAVRVGDHVNFASGYRDKTLPCSYVPNLINDMSPTPR